MTYILGIETSCDETGVAIYGEPGGLVAQALYSQIELHAEYGGVVPELASRDHIRKLLPLIEQVLFEAELTRKDISAIAYTAGPGLMGALLVGAAFARSLGFAWGAPTLGIHHMEGHLLAPMIEIPLPEGEEKPILEFPFLALLVSGGHTLLVSVQGLGKYKILGETLDDAVGEAFDKTAKLLGLPYPGGAKLSALAQKGISGRFDFPRPLLKKAGLDFSFSGLKTSVANTLRQCDPSNPQVKADIARAFEEAVIETLWKKSLRGLKSTGLTRLVVAGGVSANLPLRQIFETEIQKQAGSVFFAPPELCTDNGAMIAYVGYLRFRGGQQDTDLEIHVKPRWSLEELT